MQARCCAFPMLVWLCCGVGYASGVADQSAGMVSRHGDLSTLEFAGNEIFSSDEIRQALARDLKVQEACRPSAPLTDLIVQLEQRLLDGYRYSGCPDAEVSISVGEEGHLLVRVVEGTRYMAGEVRVRGTSKVDEASLTRSLCQSVEKSWLLPNMTLQRGGQVIGPVEVAKEKQEGMPKGKSEKSEYAKTYWTSAEPVRFGGISTDEMRPRVAEALLRQGYPEATFRLKIEANEELGVADLLVEVEDLGPRSIVEEVAIVGLDRHTPAQLLELMQLAEGQEIDTEIIQRAIERVRESCRFWGCNVTVDYPAPQPTDSKEGAGGTKLLIEVIEYPHVAPLGEPLGEPDEILRRAARWIQQFHQQEEWELEGELAYPEGEVYGGSKARFWLSPIEGIMLDLQVKGSPSESNLLLDGEYRLIAGSAGLAFADIGHGDWISTKLQVTTVPRLQLTEGKVERGDFKTLLNFSFGVSSEAEPHGPLARVHPITLIDLAHNEGTRCEVKEGVLWIGEKDLLEATFDVTTGRLLQLEIGQGEPKGFRVATVPRDPVGWRGREAEVASYISRWDGGRPIASLIDYALDIATRIVKEEPPAANSKRAALQHLVDSRPFAALERFFINKWINNAPAIPVASFQLPDSFKGHYDPKYSLAGLPDYLFVRETWPWTLCREASYYHSKHGMETQGIGRKRELDRVLARDDTGPVCHWVLGKVGETDKYTARHVLEQFEDGTFAREIDMLTTPGTGLCELLKWLVPLAGSTTDEEIDKLLSTVTDSFDKPVIQAAQLLRQLDATSDETLRDSLGRMLRDDLRPLIEADLRKLADGRGKVNRPTLDFSPVVEPFPAAVEKREEKKPEEPKILSGVQPFEEEGVGEEKE